MRRRDLLAAPLAAAGARAAARRPNFLLITADDLGLELGCYGEKRIPTPHMDRLAASGVRFETAYVVQASCSPSRSGIFTGVFPHGNGQYGLANTGYTLHEPMRRATIPAVLKEAGYRTGILGKLHVEPEESFPWDFDQRKSHGKMRDAAVAPALARQFFQENAGRPFFLMVNCPDPHAQRQPNDPTAWSFPHQVNGEPKQPLAPGPSTVWDFQGVDTPLQRERVAGYLNCVRRFDTIVGGLMEELKRAGREADTVVILIGDHGPPFERGKTTCYESGLRIPFLVRWPGVSRPSVGKAMVSTSDIAPTIFDAAGVRSPVRTDGRSLRPVLTGGTQGWREYLGAEFHYHGGNIFFPRRALRDRRWKIVHNIRAGQLTPPVGIDGDRAVAGSKEPNAAAPAARAALERFANPPEWEFFDLQADPVEFHNLAGRPEVRREQRRMEAALLAWRRETHDPFLDPAFLARVVKEGAPATRKRKQ